MIIQAAAGNPLSGKLIAVVALATVAAYPCSRLLLSYYRRRVVRGMSARAALQSHEPLPADAVDDLPGALPRARISLQDRDVAADKASPLYSRALRAANRTALLYAAAGISFALVMSASFTTAAGAGLDAFVVAFVALVFAWPAVLAANIAAGATRGERLRVVAAYTACLGAFGTYAVAARSELTAGQVIVLWLIMNLPATLILGGYLTRNIRAVGPLVWSFLLASLAGVVLALDAASTAPGMRILADIAFRTGLGATSALLAVALVGALLLAPVGYLGGRWLGRRYERKRISDQSITIDAMFLGFAVMQSILPVSNGGAIWLLAGATAFAAYVLTTRAGFRFMMQRAAPSAGAPRLLLLRAFSLGRRSEQLLDQLARRWRYVGSIQLIAGPDLAASTIEPHEFLDFLRGRMARRFVDRPETLERKLAELDLQPDHDGRFRVNEFFCHDDMWRRVMLRLVPISDVILVDLRGFTRQHAGLTFEIQQLIRFGALDRIILLVDVSTDEAYLRELADTASAPHTSATVDSLAVMRVVRQMRGDSDIQASLLAAVCETARPAALPVTA